MATCALVSQPAKWDSTIPHVSPHGLEGSEDIQIYLTTLAPNNSVIPLKILSSDTIASVKMRIQACKGFFVKQQRLVYGGRELCRQDSLVKDYGVTNGKVLHLVLRFSELQVVTIKTVSGKEHVFKIDRKKCVRDLKQRISKKEGGVAIDEQHLVFRGEDLEDKMRIDDLPLEEDAVVHLFVRSTAKVRSKCTGSDVELSVTAAEPLQKKTDEEHFANPTALLPVKHDIDGKVERLKFRKDAGARHEHPVPIFGLPTVQSSSVLLDLIQQVRAGLEHGHSPVLSSEGSGGTYFMQDEYGADIIGVFKPMDEEPMASNNPRGLPLTRNGEGLKRGTRVGEGALREVAAYILDHPVSGQKRRGFAGVPPTIMVRCFHKAFCYSKNDEGMAMEGKIGSLQLFVHALSSCEDMGPASFPVHEVHKIAVLDMRLANTDRNGSNILVCKQGDAADLSLVPIDHGYCLPDKFEDCTFEWLYWPQAKVPFQPKTLEYIAALDAEADITLLQDHGWNLPAECAWVLRVGTMLLKKGAAAGLTPYEIGSMMCRETLNKKSLIEEMLEDAEGTVLPASSENALMEALSDIMDTHIQTAKAQMYQAQKMMGSY